MACYDYLKEGTWLGHEYYTPEVVISFVRPDGQGQVNFKMESDSGAAISLLPRSSASMLGITDLESGEPVLLGGVGGTTFYCYVHELDASLGEGEPVRIPVAFGPDDNFPPLLGRLGLYEQADVLMDNASLRTCFLGSVSATPNVAELDWTQYLAVGGLAILLLVVVLR